MPNHNIKVSVVMVTYNHEKYIRRAIDSIMRQNVNFDFEVLVGEDCSKDGTAIIVKEYADKYPDVIIPFLRDRNMGMTKNELDIIVRTRGEYIAFLEGDDYWIDDNKLQKQVDFLDAHCECEACFGLCWIVDQNDVRLPEIEKYSGFIKQGGEYTIKEFEDYLLPGQTATSMFRHNSFVETIKDLKKSDYDMSGFMDRHYALIALSKGKIYNSGDFISAYRYVLAQGSGSWSSENDNYSIKNLLNYLDGLKEIEHLGNYLGLTVDFDDRRKFEWDKYINNRSLFSKTEKVQIRNKILFDSNNRFGILKYIIMKRIRK
ncbi:glycosyltransferase [Butyrivibrio sp. WCD2001]|uniref:glycosyltransferase n=1 Tax=Butyrivibrio sp. WCD2001 TaxID=1280681 RepID=UPI0003FC4C47|nr:glycosyltransferase [Butyrivibrio sp. WCD2001]